MFLYKSLNDIDNFNNIKPRNKNTKEKKPKVYNTVLEFYNEFLNKNFDECYNLEIETKEEMRFKFMPIDLIIKGYDYSTFCNETRDRHYGNYQEQQEEHINLPDIPSLEGDIEEVKKKKD